MVVHIRSSEEADLVGVQEEGLEGHGLHHSSSYWDSEGPVPMYPARWSAIVVALVPEHSPEIHWNLFAKMKSAETVEKLREEQGKVEYWIELLVLEEASERAAKELQLVAEPGSLRG